MGLNRGLTKYIIQVRLTFVKKFFKTWQVHIPDYNRYYMSYLPQTTNNNKVLTEKQQSFLDHLITTNGNPKEAAELAGYSGNYHQVIKSLRQEVIELASDVLARSAPQAAFKLVDIMNSDKPIPQVSNKLQAAQTILDRVGVSKSDKLDVTHKAAGGIFILPEKAPIEAEAEDITYDEWINNDSMAINNSNSSSMFWLWLHNSNCISYSNNHNINSY